MPDRVRVNARLIQAGTGVEMWSGTLERPLEPRSPFAEWIRHWPLAQFCSQNVRVSLWLRCVLGLRDLRLYLASRFLSAAAVQFQVVGVGKAAHFYNNVKVNMPGYFQVNIVQLNELHFVKTISAFCQQNTFFPKGSCSFNFDV